MLNKFTFVLLLLISFLPCFSQEYSPDSKIAPDQLKEDFSVVISSLRDHHPGLFTFFPKNQFDSIAQANLKALSDSLTEDEFFIYVRKFLIRIRCGHTTALPSTAWFEYVKAEQKLIPVHVFLKKDELYLRNVFDVDQDELIGLRIISIDGTPSSKVVSEMKSIIQRDGFGETMVNRNVERMFRTYYVMLYGVKDSHSIQVEAENGEIIQTVLKGQTGKKHVYPVSHDLEEVIQASGAKFGMLKDSSNTALLQLSNFSNKGYKKFYRHVFKTLSEMENVNLIIDLRGNGGGYFPHGSQLLRYLMDEKFTMDFSKSTKRSKKSKYLKMNFRSKMTRFVFSTIPDRNKADSSRNYQIRYKPFIRNHFNGDVSILTDGLTFSMGSFVTSKLKNGINAKVIGEETGGGEVGFNATLMWNLILPNSKIRVKIPMYHVDVQPKMDDVGRGVMPSTD